MGERGGHPGRGSPGDWQRQWAGREGRGRSQLVRVKNSGGGRALPFLFLLPLPPLPHLPPPLPFPSPSPSSSSSSSSSGCSFSGEPLTFPELGKPPRARAGTPAGRRARRPDPPHPGRRGLELARRGPQDTRGESRGRRAVSGRLGGRRAGGRKGRSEEGAPRRRVNEAKVSGAALKGAVLLLPWGERLEGNTGATRRGPRSRGEWTRVLGGGRCPAKVSPRFQVLRREDCFAFSDPPPPPPPPHSRESPPVLTLAPGLLGSKVFHPIGNQALSQFPSLWEGQASGVSGNGRIRQCGTTSRLEGLSGLR